MTENEKAPPVLCSCCDEPIGASELRDAEGLPVCSDFCRDAMNGLYDLD